MGVGVGQEGMRLGAGWCKCSRGQRSLFLGPPGTAVGRTEVGGLVFSWKKPGALLPRKGPLCSVRVALTLRVEYGAFLGSEMAWADLGGP